MNSAREYRPEVLFRSRSKDGKHWSPDPEKGYGILLGDGSVPWKKVFQAAERAGGVESYIIEQQGGSGYRPMDTVERCLAAFRKLHDY